MKSIHSETEKRLDREFLVGALAGFLFAWFIGLGALWVCLEPIVK